MEYIAKTEFFAFLTAVKSEDISSERGTVEYLYPRNRFFRKRVLHSHLFAAYKQRGSYVEMILSSEVHLKHRMIETCQILLYQ